MKQSAFPLFALALLFTPAATSRAIDPDIQKALKEAPPAGDYIDALSFNSGISPAQLNARIAMEHHLVLLKLAQIRVAPIDFKDTPALTAFQWLVDQSRAFDSQQEGIVLAFDIRVLTGWDHFKPLDHTVTLSLPNPHFDEALAQITKALKLRYEVEGTVVYIRPAE